MEETPSRNGRTPGRKSHGRIPKSSGAYVPAADGAPVEPWILTCAGFLAIGMSVAEIGKRLHRGRETIRRVRDEHPELILQAVRQLTNPADVFAPMLPGAASSYTRALARGDTTTAKDVFDRLYGKPLVREQRLERKEIRITFVDGPD